MNIKLILESGTCSKKNNKWTKIFLINKEQFTLTYDGVLTKTNDKVEIVGAEKEALVSAINNYESTEME